LSYRVTSKLSVAAEGRLDEFVSNDARIQHGRGRYSLGFVWRRD
jgi:hypothetical protein